MRLSVFRDQKFYSVKVSRIVHLRMAESFILVVSYKGKEYQLDSELIFKSGNDNDSASYGNFMSKKETQSPERLLIKKEESKLLGAAVDKLPIIQKTLLLLFHQDELSLDEISAIIEMTLNTVKSHLFRARTSLKEMLLQHKN